VIDQVGVQEAAEIGLEGVGLLRKMGLLVDWKEVMEKAVVVGAMSIGW
jgi:hypothetical protein